MICSLKCTETHITLKLILSHLDRFYRTLLEQGIDYRDDKIPYKGWWMSGMVLGGIVISNAYMSINVYNLSLPTTRLRYENIQQLLAENFLILSRLTTLHLIPSWEESLGWQKVQIRNSSWTEFFHSSHFLASFGALNESHISIAGMRELRNIEDDQDVSGDLSVLINSSSFHPSVKMLIMETLREIRNQYNSNNNGITDTLEEIFVSIYRRKENDLLFDTIRNCSRTALDLPEQEAVQFKERLLNQPDFKAPI